MAKIKNCVVVGIERVEGKRKSDGKAFGFWKLHCLAPFSERVNGRGHNVVSCLCNDEDYQNSTIELNSNICIVSSRTQNGNSYEFGYEE